MSLSTRKKGESQIPEVVIEVNQRSSTKRSSAIKDPIKAVQQKELDIDQAFAGLSRLEQIKLRARKNAEEEDRKNNEEEESRLKRKTYGSDEGDDEEDDDDDDDDDDELPSLDVGRNPRSDPVAISSPLSSAPALSQRSNTLPSDSQSGPSSSIPRYESCSPTSSPNEDRYGSPPTDSRRRSRRKVARSEPYIFRPSFDPLSERRRKLQLAKESAAVQARLMKREDFKSHDERNDPIEKILREQRRERKKGLDREGLDATIRIMTETDRLIEEADRKALESRREQAEMNNEEDSDVMSDDDSSLSSSDSEGPSLNLAVGGGDRHVRFSGTLPHEEKEREQRKLEVLIGDDFMEEANGQEAFEILRKDRDDSKRSTLREAHDVGLEERKFWKNGKGPTAIISFPIVNTSSAVYDMLREAFASHQTDLAALLLETNDFTGQLNNTEGQEAHMVFCWLLEVAILTKTSTLSYAALRALRDAITISAWKVLKIVLIHIPNVLIKMGGKVDVIRDCFNCQENKDEDVSFSKANNFLRHNERLRAMERFLQVVDLLAKYVRLIETAEGEVALTICLLPSRSLDALEPEESLAIQDYQTNLFIVTLRLSVDPSHEELGMQFERSLGTVLDSLLKDRREVDSSIEVVLIEALSTLLKNKSQTFKRFLVDNIPSTNFRSRALQRCLAHLLVFDSAKNSTGTLTLSNYSMMAGALASKDTNLNPILATEGRDYKQLEANVQLICYCFNDLSLQLIAPITSDKGQVSVKGALKRSIEHCIKNDGHLEAQLGDAKDWKVNLLQIDSIHQIMDSVHLRGNQIQDGKGAFLDRSRVKDQLQRLRLMLLYQLGSFGMAGSKTSTSLQQGTLSKWFTNK